MTLHIEDDNGQVQIMDDGTTIADILWALSLMKSHREKFREKYRKQYVPKKLPKEPKPELPKRPRGRPRKNPPAIKFDDGLSE